MAVASDWRAIGEIALCYYPCLCQKKSFETPSEGQKKQMKRIALGKFCSLMRCVCCESLKCQPTIAGKQGRLKQIMRGSIERIHGTGERTRSMCWTDELELVKLVTSFYTASTSVVSIILLLKRTAIKTLTVFLFSFMSVILLKKSEMSSHLYFYSTL